MDVLSCTDAQWAHIAPLLTPLKHHRGKPATPHRLVLEGLLWLMRHGAPWTALPSAFGTAKTASHRYARWLADGTWAAILAILRQRALPPPDTFTHEVGL